MSILTDTIIAIALVYLVYAVIYHVTTINK